MSRKNIYDFSISEAETLKILIPEEYFFPDFLSTIEFLEKQNYYSKVKKVILDFGSCNYLNGIGMGLEVQMFFIESKEAGRDIYWIGNFKFYKILWRLSEFEFKSEDIIPYFSSINEIKSK